MSEVWQIWIGIFKRLAYIVEVNEIGELVFPVKSGMLMNFCSKTTMPITILVDLHNEHHESLSGGLMGHKTTEDNYYFLKDEY